jgi:hypothetical protein
MLVTKPNTAKSVVVKLTRKVPRERKTPHSVQNQLANRAPKKGATVLLFDTVTGKDIKEAVAELNATGKTSLPALKSKSQATGKAPATPEFTRGQLGKINRAFRRAGKTDVSQAEKNKFLAELLAAKVPVMERTSTRISKVLLGKSKVEDLK